MTIENVSIQMYRGDNRNVVVTVTDGDDVAINLTDGSMKFTVKDSVDDTVNVFQLTSATVTEIDFTDAAAGEATIYLTPTQTGELSGQYVFDIQFVNSDGKIYTVTYGVFTIVKDVTTS